MRGVNVPDDPNCVFQRYLDSTVTEHYLVEMERDARAVQLLKLGRRPLTFTSHQDNYVRRDTYAVRWEEPRGEELDAIRTGSESTDV
jgi:hypothetical protein